MKRLKYNFKSKLADSKFIRSIVKFWRWKSNVSKLKYLLFVYLLVVLISSLLLFSPWAQNPKEEHLGYIGSLFTAASAFSDTGLVVTTTFRQWNDFGQAIIAILILSGGIGIFALKFFIINFIFGKKSSSLGEMKLVQGERGGTDTDKIAQIIISSVKFLFICIFVFSIALTIYFYFASPMNTTGINELLKNSNDGNNFQSPQYNFSLSLKFGIFHTISAINNAGFDIISGFSLMPYYQNYFLQICFIILLVIGGLGYPTIYDFACYFKHKMRNEKKPYNFSLFTKVSLVTYVLVFLVGFVIAISFETSTHNDPFSIWNRFYVPDEYNKQYIEWFKNGKDFSNLSTELKPYIYEGNEMYGNWFDKTFATLFTSFSTRSAGFATVDVKNFTPGSTFVFIFMMIIGSAPASTGGGIRTTTFALIIMGIWRVIFGIPRVRMFKRAINQDTVNMSSQILAIALILIIIASLVLFTSFDVSGGVITTLPTNEDNYVTFSAQNIVFEVASAFGTTGLSSGVTSKLNYASQLMLILVMFIGQFGISSTLLVWARKKNGKRTYEYIDADIAIG
ncbi:TrkH family potassium uptake protein [Mycoplasmopsis verecunda]|uniref:Trk-type K+ transport system, membrane component n=1 Tax=Mycoplasmopsis verecunda TaxID=171291 RepID=A0A1T4KDU5_9BACT|nr:potassium transporter TrkG [Mycoplasmopsis verecunda]WPB54866.1 potassium transporter TrkG [Mycoplasmopsis verecunda]SJZ40579.1 Trk-type K+ transport system, membrane component [Mycoplasmopsis verecunda]